LVCSKDIILKDNAVVDRYKKTLAITRVESFKGIIEGYD